MSKPDIPLASQLFRLKESTWGEPGFGEIAEGNKVLTDAQLPVTRSDKFRRELGIRSEEIREQRMRDSLLEPSKYLKSKHDVKESIINALEGAYSQVVMIHLAAGETEEDAKDAAIAAIKPFKTALFAALRKIYPDEADTAALNIQHIKVRADKF